jgi:hypothetical protein
MAIAPRVLSAAAAGRNVCGGVRVTIATQAIARVV